MRSPIPKYTRYSAGGATGESAICSYSRRTHPASTNYPSPPSTKYTRCHSFHTASARKTKTSRMATCLYSSNHYTDSPSVESSRSAVAQAPLAETVTKLVLAAEIHTPRLLPHNHYNT